MLHWIPAPAIAFLGARPSSAVLPGDPAACARSLRAMHALMLGYAAQRRRAAVDPRDAIYWKAAQGCVLDKARALRANEGFIQLP